METSTPQNSSIPASQPASSQLTNDQKPYYSKSWGFWTLFVGLLPHAIMAKHNWKIFGQPAKGTKILIFGIFYTILLFVAYPIILLTMGRPAAQIFIFAYWIIAIIIGSMWGKALHHMYKEMKTKYGFQNGKSVALLYIIFFALEFIIAFIAPNFFKQAIIR
ncbi:MAG: hypothetical protein Q7S48_04305 [bacterium]|nr:hypothetical protein [bacterium]